MRQFIIAMLLILVVVIFAVQNAEIVFVKFISWKLDMSLSLLLIITLFLGTLIGALLLTPKFLRNSSEISKLRKQLNEKK